MSTREIGISTGTRRATGDIPRLVACALTLSAAGTAVAAGKILEERYDPNRVYAIQTASGCVTLVELEQGEVVAPSSNGGIGMGDAQAWGMAVAGNRIFFKPAKESPQTNLIVATNRRTYAFDLHHLSSRNSCPRSSGATYVLRFSYPQDAAQRASQQRRDEAALDAKAKPASINTNYTWRGTSVSLKPAAAWDDGRFTRLQYDSAAELPQFYKVLPDGSEALVNKSLDIDDPTIVVLHELARKVRVRLGGEVIEITNRGYQPPAFNRQGAGFPGSSRKPGNGLPPSDAPPAIARASTPAAVEPSASGSHAGQQQASAFNLQREVQAPSPAKYTVSPDVRTVRELLSQWAAVDKLPLHWRSDVDYPLTRAMRSVSAQSLDEAMGSLSSALAGVRRPLVLARDAAGLHVTDGTTQSGPQVQGRGAGATASRALSKATGRWHIGENRSLRSIVETWGSAAGYAVIWHSGSNVQVTPAMREISFDGTLREALVGLSRLFGELRTPLRMTFSEDDTLRPTLLVKED